MTHGQNIYRFKLRDLENLNHSLNYTIEDDEEKLVKVKINGKQYSPIELSSYVLKELKIIAELKLNQQIDKVVITVPAYFNDSQRQATRDAGKLAGMDVLRIINEPTAASLAYGIGQNTEEGETVAIYDLGGGTFDISILFIQNGIFEVLSTHGDTYLGGDDFDKAIVNHWIEEHSLHTLSTSDSQNLRVTAERAKKSLSTATSFESTIDLEIHKIKLTLSIKQLNELVKPLIDKTMQSCRNAITDAELSITDIQEVILVGGSTRGLAVKEAVSSFFSSANVNDKLNQNDRL